jgi:2-iminoacetate synthase
MFAAQNQSLLNEMSGFIELAASARIEQVDRSLDKSNIKLEDLAILLSQTALEHRLEPMAERSRDTTRAHFGNVISLFTPLYISNVCDNFCRYCSFRHDNPIKRRHLESEEIKAECERIAASGMRNVLVLTGESRRLASPEYLQDAIGIIRDFFASVAIEVYPQTEDEYRLLVGAGADALTIFQEVYNPALYPQFHAGGPKADYAFRLDAPDRAAAAGMHAVNIGPLLGLADFRSEALWTAAHLKHLQNAYPGMELAVSLPRVRPLAGEFKPGFPVSDREYVQLLCAMRMAFPTVGITVSTRESSVFRNAIATLGVTRMSAGVSTAVGGHSEDPSTTQFEIADSRSVDEMRNDLMKLGLQPVMHDWHHRLTAR